MQLRIRFCFPGAAGVALVWSVLAGTSNAQEAGVDASDDGSLDEIVVTATRRGLRQEDVPASIVAVDLDQARRDGFTTGTDEFRGVPGVFFRRGEGDGDEFPFVSFRGSLGTEGYLAMLDGIPFIGLDEEPLLTQVPYDAVDRIEIVKGPVSALYGRGGLYGAVNYLTKAPDSDESSLSITTGSDNYYRAEGSLARSLARSLGRDAGAVLSAAYENSNGWRDHGGRELLNLFGKLSYPVADATTLTAYVNYSDRDSEIPNGLPLSATGEVVPVAGGPEAFLGYGDTRNDQQVLIGTLRLEHQVTEDLQFSISGQARRIDQSRPNTGGRGRSPPDGKRSS